MAETISERTLYFRKIARQALEQYDLDDLSLNFINHSENVTFKVHKPGSSQAYLLRIHSPIAAAMGDHGSDPDAIASELLWLEALCRDTDLLLQNPLRNREGELVTRVQADRKSAPVNCSLLTWINGEPYSREAETDSTVRSIARLMGQLHNHAAGWSYPEWFKRPTRDMPYFQAMLRVLQTGVEDGKISPKQEAKLRKAAQRLATLLQYAPQQRPFYGLMHADMHIGNMLLVKGKVCLIDFSFCAFGPFLFDIAICLASIAPLHRPAFFEDYTKFRPLPENFETLIEGLYVGSMLGTFAYALARPKDRNWLQTRLPHFVEQQVEPFLNGEHFWFPLVGS